MRFSKSFYFLMLSVLMLLINCQDGDADLDPSDVNFNFSRSDCKGMKSVIDIDADVTDTVHLTTDYTNSVLTVTLVNLYWNCCPEFVYDSDVDSKTITITTKDEAADHCHCMCHFDLNSDITGLTKGLYTIKYIINYEWNGQDVGMFDTLTTTVSIP